MNIFSTKFYILVHVYYQWIRFTGFDLKKYYFLLIDSFLYSNYNNNKLHHNLHEVALIINFKDLLIGEAIDIIIQSMFFNERNCCIINLND